jgi:hypothetical protein
MYLAVLVVEKDCVTTLHHPINFGVARGTFLSRGRNCAKNTNTCLPLNSFVSVAVSCIIPLHLWSLLVVLWSSMGVTCVLATNADIR